MRVHAKETVETEDRVFSVYYLSQKEAPFLLEDVCDDQRRVCVRSDVKKEIEVLGKGMRVRKSHAWYQAWVIFPKDKAYENVIEDLYRYCDEDDVDLKDAFPYLSDQDLDRLRLGNECKCLSTYGKYQPTTFDERGQYFTDKDDSADTWLVLPFMKSRDSNTLEAETYRGAWEYLRLNWPESVKELTFNHWACGWFNIAIIEPQSDAHRKVQQMMDSEERFDKWAEESEHIRVVYQLSRDARNMQESLGDCSSVTQGEVHDRVISHIGYDAPEEDLVEFSDILTNMLEELGLYTTA